MINKGEIMNITNLNLQGLNLKLSDNDYDSLFKDGVSVVINGKIFKMEGAVSCSGKMSSNNPYIPDEEDYTMDVLNVLSDDEELTTSEDTEEDSFDNLVYVEPKHVNCNTYYVVEKDKLSESQWEFLLGNVPLEYEPEDTDIYLNLDPDDRKWFGDIHKSEKQDIYISFNDIFQEVN